MKKDAVGEWNGRLFGDQDPTWHQIAGHLYQIEELMSDGNGSSTLVRCLTEDGRFVCEGKNVGACIDQIEKGGVP